MVKYQVTTAAASEPVSLSEAKLWLKVDFSADDDLITALIQAAREMVENYTNRKLMPQTVTERFNSFPSENIVLSAAPLASVTSINYTDEDGAPQVLNSSKYIVQDYALPAQISVAYSETWPTTRDEANAVNVVYVVGYADADSVPQALKNAIKMTLAYMYENRTDKVKKLPTQVEYICWPYRIVF